MARGLEGRIERLENGHGPECPECGGSRDGVEEFEVSWYDEEPSEAEDEGPEYCPECGRQLVFTVTWGDIDYMEERGPWD